MASLQTVVLGDHAFCWCKNVELYCGEGMRCLIDSLTPVDHI